MIQRQVESKVVVTDDFLAFISTTVGTGAVRQFGLLTLWAG